MVYAAFKALVDRDEITFHKNKDKLAYGRFIFEGTEMTLFVSEEATELLVEKGNKTDWSSMHVHHITDGDKAGFWLSTKSGLGEIIAKG